MRLDAPDSLTTRPVMDRVKEALFNFLRATNRIEGKRYLDVFSGVGSFGLEALSRGASECLFVENDRAVLEYLDRNIDHTRLGANAVIRRSDVLLAFEAFKRDGQRFDVIILDPPFPMANAWLDALSQPAETLANRDRQVNAASKKIAAIVSLAFEIVEPQGMIILRVETRPAIALVPPAGFSLESRRYGRSTLLIIEGNRSMSASV